MAQSDDPEDWNLITKRRRSGSGRPKLANFKIGVLDGKVVAFRQGRKEGEAIEQRDVEEELAGAMVWAWLVPDGSTAARRAFTFPNGSKAMITVRVYDLPILSEIVCKR